MGPVPENTNFSKMFPPTDDVALAGDDGTGGRITKLSTSLHEMQNTLIKVTGLSEKELELCTTAFGTIDKRLTKLV